MPNSVPFIIKFPSYYDFYSYCETQSLLNLNFRSKRIYRKLAVVYYNMVRDPKSTHSHIKASVSKKLGIQRKNTILTTRFYTTRGYTLTCAKSKVSKLQKSNSKRAIDSSSLKGRFSKEWFQDKFGDDWEKHYKEKNAKSSPALKNFVVRHGEEKGTQLYKKKNAASAITLENQIKKYGIEEGTARWNSYCERQKYTCSVEYFQEKYGEEEGIIRWKESYNKLARRSKIADQLFSNITTLFKSSEKVYTGEDEWCVFLDQRERNATRQQVFRVDFKHGNKIIEFFGKMYHASPRQYTASEIVPIPGSPEVASCIWWKNYQRIKILEDRGFEVMVIWEDEYIRSPSHITTQALDFLNNL